MNFLNFIKDDKDLSPEVRQGRLDLLLEVEKAHKLEKDQSWLFAFGLGLVVGVLVIGAFAVIFLAKG